MDFRIADTFTDSLSRLTGDEQKAVKTTAFDLQMNAASPGLSFHKLDKVKDKNFWSVRVSSDIRIIVHRTDSSLLLCYVDHHDKAYSWAERRKLETHPKTGAAQLVEIRETIKEVVVPVYTHLPAVHQPAQQRVSVQPFAGLSDDELLSYGVPSEWLGDVKVATEESFLTLSSHLPAEAAEALLELATGGKPRLPQSVLSTTNPFDHPDAQRRFRVMTNVEELQRALDYPWEKWTVFLHPEQRQLVENSYSGPFRVSGSAGTGKTVVALHRAVHLLRVHRESRILLTTFSDTLASALQTKLKRLLGNEPRLGERIDVYSLDAIGLRLHQNLIGPVEMTERKSIMDLLKSAAHGTPGHKFGTHFLITEWDEVVDAWQIKNWEAYRDFVRLGRKTRLSESQRKVLWAIFEKVQSDLVRRKHITWAQLFTCLAEALKNIKNPVFDFTVIDESQDLTVSQLKFLGALGGGRTNALFFAGDLGQRIFQQPFSWKSLGVDIRGRSRTLRVNYRTSHQIRTHADRLLGPVMIDVDGNSEDRSDTISVFNGPVPKIEVLPSIDEEISKVAHWLRERVSEGIQPHELGVFVRSKAEIGRATKAVQQAKLKCLVLDHRVETAPHQVSVGTMHLAKGLEFRAVVVMACDDEVIPLQERIEAVGDDSDLQEVYDTERHLLYVACTRARDHLLVTGSRPASEFLDDLQKQSNRKPVFGR